MPDHLDSRVTEFIASMLGVHRVAVGRQINRAGNVLLWASVEHYRPWRRELPTWQCIAVGRTVDELLAFVAEARNELEANQRRGERLRRLLGRAA